MWVPDLGTVRSGGVRDLVESWLGSFVNIATLMKRLDTGDGNYLPEMETDMRIQSIFDQIRATVHDNEAKCQVRPTRPLAIVSR